MLLIIKPWASQPQTAGVIEPASYWKSRGIDFLAVAPAVGASIAGVGALPSAVGTQSNSKWSAIKDRQYSNADRNRLPRVVPITLVALFRQMGTFGTTTYPSPIDFTSVFGNSARAGHGIGVGGDLGAGAADVRRIYSVVRNVGYANNERLIKITTAATVGVWYFVVQRLTASAHELIVPGLGSASGTTGTPGSNSVDGLDIGRSSGAASTELALAARFSSALTDAEIVHLAADPWQLLSPRRIWVPVSAGGGSSLDLAASALAVSGALTASGDLQFRLPLNLSASPIAVTGAATVSGDLAYRVPIDLSASAVAVTGSASVSGDIQSTTDPKLNISGSAIAVTGSLSATGDIQITEAPTLDLSASSVAVTGTVGAAGTLAYRVPFNLAADPIIVAGVFAASGDIGLSTEPVGVRGGGGWAWAAPSDASRYKRLKPQTREQLAERVRKQREALGILPAPARKRIEAAVKKEARRAAPSLAPLAPVAAEVAQDTGIALRRVLDAIEAAYDYQRGLVTARIEADAAHAEERRHQAAEQARVEAEAAEQEWQRRLVNLRAADDELLRQDDEARQQAIATIRQVQKALMALVAA